jgi:biopolymer transport protein ExbD
MGEDVTRNELDRRLKIEAARGVQPEIHIEPDRDAQYGVVAHVMAAAQRNGLKKMGVIGGT